VDSFFAIAQNDTVYKDRCIIMFALYEKTGETLKLIPAFAPVRSYIIEIADSDKFEIEYPQFEINYACLAN